MINRMEEVEGIKEENITLVLRQADFIKLHHNKVFESSFR